MAKSQLRTKIEARQTDLESALAGLKAEAVGGTTMQMQKIQTSLEQLQRYLPAVWEEVTESDARKLGHWLTTSSV